MKNSLSLLARGLFITSLVILFNCSDDGATPANTNDPGDPNDFCNVEACQANGTLKAVCINEYTDCVALGKSTKAECAAFAVETCTI